MAAAAPVPVPALAERLDELSEKANVWLGVADADYAEAEVGVDYAVELVDEWEDTHLFSCTRFFAHTTFAVAPDRLSHSISNRRFLKCPAWTYRCASNNELLRQISDGVTELSLQRHLTLGRS